MPKVLIHTICFSPDGVSTAYLYNDIALKFKEKGYEVVVLTTTPHYNIVEDELRKQPLKRKFLGFYSTSDYQGVLVKHIPQRKFKSSLLRIIGFLYWHFSSLILGLFEKNVDVILSPSPPLSLGLLNIVLGRLKGAKVIYNVQEIYPDLLIEGGGLKSKGIISVLKCLERFVYNHSDKVTTIDQVFYDTIADRFKDRKKLHVIPNFVDTDIYKPRIIGDFEIDEDYFPTTDALKLMYAGNIGYAQDWETLVKIALQLKNENIEFFIIGEGVMKGFLEDEIRDHELTKVHIIPYQARETMPLLIAYSDMQFIFMSPQTQGHGFPSKVYTIMACAKPMLVSSGFETPIINFLKEKNCAFLFYDKDSTERITQIVNALKTIDKKSLIDMGERGLIDVKFNYSKETVTDMYVDIVNLML